MALFKARCCPSNIPAPPPATPEALVRLGPTLAVQMEVPTSLAQQLAASGQPIPHPITGIALLDTGASGSAVDRSVVSNLGLHPVGSVNVSTPSGTQPMNLYPIMIRLPQLGGQFEYDSVIEAELAGQGIMALLGRDMLQKTVLIYDGPGAEFTIAL